MCKICGVPLHYKASVGTNAANAPQLVGTQFLNASCDKIWHTAKDITSLFSRDPTAATSAVPLSNNPQQLNNTLEGEPEVLDEEYSNHSIIL